MPGGSAPLAGGRGDVARRVDGKPIFFVIGAIAEAVLEIDAEVLDRLARQLVDEPRVDAVGEREIEPDRRRRACPPPARTRPACVVRSRPASGWYRA